ncbi:MAG: peptide-methionine (R)-S-oxide reductase MsrB [Saprospiraceae bacterium]|nr:peptide-methionine (R)-S-oxide reductase MsrB [Candidatus Opimibacter skivensis]
MTAISSTLTYFLLCFNFISCTPSTVPVDQKTTSENADKENPYYSRTDTTILKVSDAEWKKILSDEVYHVAREQGTERAFTGKYWDHKGIGTYYCAVCGNALFKSDGKFASECGWPSFFETMRTTSVTYKEDRSHNMERIEVNCGRCASHLGHLFDDGPPPTYKRYCMNSIVLEFEPEAKE